METVSFITAESGDDLIVSFAMSEPDEPSAVESLILMRTPKHELIFDEDERGVRVSFERHDEDKNDRLEILDAPGATASYAYGTYANGISGNNVAGDYWDSSGSHGYIYNGSSFTTLNNPAGANGTRAYGISGNNVVGFYYDSDNRAHGFLYNGGSYTTLDDPLGTTGTYAMGISGSDIVGYYSDSASLVHGFLYDGHTYTTLDDPLANTVGGGGTFVSAISGNVIVGDYTGQDGGSHGFEATLVPEPDSVLRLAFCFCGTMFLRRRVR